MLIQFNFSNFKSFREDTLISMRASDHTNIKNNIKVKNGIPLTAVSIVYGTNGSGKSSFIDAIRSLSMYVSISNYTDSSISSSLYINPFRTSLDKPTKFEITFFCNDVFYQYGLNICNGEIVEEYLNKTQEFSPLFARRNNDIVLNLKESDDENIQLTDSIQPMIMSHVPILSMWNSLESDDVNSAYKWISSIGLNLVENIDSFRTLLDLGIYDKDTLEDANRFLTSFDIGVSSISLEDHMIMCKHVTDTETFYLPITEESRATQKLVALAIDISKAIEEETLLLIDDLETNVHPIILKHIIKLFNGNQNSSGQLIFSSNDTFILSDELLRADQVWFVNKNINLESSISRLFETSISDKHNQQADVYWCSYLQQKFLTPLNPLHKLDCNYY